MAMFNMFNSYVELPEGSVLSSDSELFIQIMSWKKSRSFHDDCPTLGDTRPGKLT